MAGLVSMSPGKSLGVFADWLSVVWLSLNWVGQVVGIITSVICAVFSLAVTSLSDGGSTEFLVVFVVTVSVLLSNSSLSKNNSGIVIDVTVVSSNLSVVDCGWVNVLNSLVRVLKIVGFVVVIVLPVSVVSWSLVVGILWLVLWLLVLSVIVWDLVLWLVWLNSWLPLSGSGWLILNLLVRWFVSV